MEQINQNLETSKDAMSLQDIQDIINKDQSDSAHTKSFDNYIELKKMESKLNSSDPLVTFSYHNACSLTEIHIAQLYLMKNGGIKEGKNFFDKAIESTKKVLSVLEAASQNLEISEQYDVQSRLQKQKDWFDYLTISRIYLDGDVDALNNFLANINTSNDNFHVINRLHKGLQEFGDVNYYRDYNGIYN